MKRLKDLLQNIINKINRIGTITTYDNLSGVSVNTSTYTNLHEFTVPKGRYLVMATAIFNANATGRRILYISSTSSAGNTAPTFGYRTMDMRNAISGVYTPLRVVCAYSSDGTLKLWLVGWQNSSSTITVTPRLQLTKLGGVTKPLAYLRRRWAI